MKLSEYLIGVNKTWKSQDTLTDLIHCRLAILEEIGEIAGWYKKHMGYGRPKDKTWLTGIKGEFGDLLYYISKVSEISKHEILIEEFYEDDLPDNLDQVQNIDYPAVCAAMANHSTSVIELSIHSEEFSEALVALLLTLRTLINYEGFELEDIQISNLSKLEVRHGSEFNNDASIEEGRNRAKEDDALM